MSRPAAPADNPRVAPRDAGAAAVDAVLAVRDASSNVPPAISPSGIAGGAPSKLDASVPVVAPAAAQDAGPVTTGAKVTLTFTTKPLLPGAARSFPPRNIVAVWIEDEGARPIKVLAVYAGAMRVRLTVFNAHVPHFFGTGFGDPPPMHADVITGATRSDHSRPIVVTWDLTDIEGLPVPDGRYTVFIEVTDRNDRTALTQIPFDENGKVTQLHVPDALELGPVDLRYDP